MSFIQALQIHNQLWSDSNHFSEPDKLQTDWAMEVPIFLPPVLVPLELPAN